MLMLMPLDQPLGNSNATWAGARSRSRSREEPLRQPLGAGIIGTWLSTADPDGMNASGAHSPRRRSRRRFVTIPPVGQALDSSGRVTAVSYDLLMSCRRPAGGYRWRNAFVCSRSRKSDRTVLDTNLGVRQLTLVCPRCWRKVRVAVAAGSRGLRDVSVCVASLR